MPHSASASQGIINTDVLNLRAEPGTWSDVINMMWQGEAVEILDGPTGDGWYMVSYNGQVGWAYGGYLAVDDATSWSDGGDYSGYGGGAAWVSTDALNVRSWAGLDADVVDLVYQGAAVSVLGGAVDGFVPISWGGGQAWVWGDYLSYDGGGGGGAAAAEPPGPEHWIDVNRSTQTVSLFVGDEAIASYWAAMGYDSSSDGFYSTAIGTYYIYSMYKELSWTDWGQTYITDWVGFDESRVNGFHSFSRDANGNVLSNGNGATGGCVALDPAGADHLFSFAEYGMRVEVHW